LVQGKGKTIDPGKIAESEGGEWDIPRKTERSLEGHSKT